MTEVSERGDVSGDGTSMFVDAFSEIMRDLYNQKLDTSSTRRSRLPMNRHAILHGEDLRFATRANAVRVFMLLNAVHYFLSAFVEADEKAA
ncbi:MAG: hypothetical protein IH863_01385 [Chloroflexi bacterium]|nr:hypothetical protein [Chloroflexota bacterium]